MFLATVSNTQFEEKFQERSRSKSEPALTILIRLFDSPIVGTVQNQAIYTSFPKDRKVRFRINAGIWSTDNNMCNNMKLLIITKVLQSLAFY